jgi:hypothetical protein
MSAWYRAGDLLPGGIEHVIPATSTLDATVARTLRDTGLPARGAAALALSCSAFSGQGICG